MKILGVRFGHDAAAALVIDGKIVADAAEERFTRIKNDTSFPIHSIEYCLRAGGIDSEELDCIALPSKIIQPEVFIFFHVPENNKYTYLKKEQSKARHFLKRLLPYDNGPSLPVLPLYQKPFKLSDSCIIHLCEHHLAHAASAAFTAGLGNQKALVVTMDGRGDGTSVAIWRLEKNRLTLLKQYGGQGSLGWFYANATEAMGWRHGSDEWKLMGLAPYGKESPGALKGFYPEYENGYLILPHDYGEFGRWNDHGANHYHGKDSETLSMFVDNLGAENFAAEVQRVAEEQAFNIILPWLAKEKVVHLCCAGGFFLNVKFNQKLWYKKLLETQWIYPNPGDSGIAAGAALHAYYTINPNVLPHRLDTMYFGPEYTDDYIMSVLNERGLRYRKSMDVAKETARYLTENYVVGWFQGRMESGPRALGNRSILMSPLKAENKDIINAKVKYREAFRPFCPSMLYEYASDYLVDSREEQFMVTSFAVKEDMKGRIPAVVHKDGTARPQMVKRELNKLYYDLIMEFGKMTGEYAILNTSFNVKGEPIVCHPREAIRCFFDTGLDVLVIGNFIIEKPALEK